MDIAWKRCIMSVFPAEVVVTEHSDQFRNSYSQASCAKLRSIQGQSMKGTQELTSTGLVLFKENSLCM